VGSSLPEHGQPAEEVLARLEELRVGDVQWRDGRALTLTYTAGPEVQAVAEEAYRRYMTENALNTDAFPSLRRMQQDVVDIVAGWLHGGDETAGFMTTGGTESILLAVKAARERGRDERGVERPNVVLPASAHAAFEKAAHYFGLESRRIPVRADWRADVGAMAAAVDDSTVLVVASAPQYPQGVIDPVADIAALAAERDIGCHVDACMGGVTLPYLARLGQDVPPFDFAVEGVTSMSVDLHKFGYTAKGASTILSRDPDIFSYQVFTFGNPPRPPDWYVTPSMTGTRPGGAIAAAWAVLQYLGEDGYLRLVGSAMRYIGRFFEGIEAILGLKVMGRPAMTVFGYTSVDPQLDIFAIADGLEARGWLVSRDEYPANAIRFMQSPGHEPYIDAYLRDLREVAELARRGEIVSKGGRAQYS
jgi:glutamate/tyrosine decarboxylase-like PLP-dependent enzyme